MLNLFPWDPNYVEHCSPVLRQNHLAVFYKGYGNWLGHPVRAFAAPLNTSIHGEITYTYPVLGGVEVSGWADDSHLTGGKGWILLSNDDGQIVGFGRKLPAGLPETVDNSRTPPSLGWVGFVSLNYAVKNVTAYVIGKRGLFALRGATPISPLQVISPKDSGAQLKGVQWQMHRSWTRGEPPPYIPYGRAPSTPIYNSWSGNDGNTGHIVSSSFAAPPEACLVLRVLQGYHSGGLSTEIMDADTNQALADIPFQDAPKQWTFWRITLPRSAKRLRILAEDSGKDWGEWIALASPTSCRPE